MPSILSETKTYLKTKSNVTDLIGSGTAARIYIHSAKQGVALPHVVLTMVPGESYEHLGGISGLAKNRIVIDSFGATELAAWNLDNVIRLELQTVGTNGLRPTFGTTVVHGITADSAEADFDPPVSGGGGAQKRYFYSRDFFFTYAESKIAAV